MLKVPSYATVDGAGLPILSQGRFQEPVRPWLLHSVLSSVFLRALYIFRLTNKDVSFDMPFSAIRTCVFNRSVVYANSYCVNLFFL